MSNCLVYDLEILQGDTYTMALIINDVDEVPIDLNNYNVSGVIKYKYSDSTRLVDLGVNKEVPYESGILTINIPASGTSSLPVGISFYDIEGYDVSGNITTKFLRGRVYVSPEITR